MNNRNILAPNVISFFIINKFQKIFWAEATFGNNSDLFNTKISIQLHYIPMRCASVRVNTTLVCSNL